MNVFVFLVAMSAMPKPMESFGIASGPKSRAQRLPLQMTTRKLSDRREFLIGNAAFLAMTHSSILVAPSSAAAASDVPALLQQIKRARAQLDPVPDLIQAEKWDSVRAILITPPLSDCWAKNAKPMLQKYAEAIGDAGGDELAVLEAREEAFTHLRYLDMAVYNNVFNPITTEGQSGATKELIRSYYEDPKTELKASIAALDEMIKIGSE